MTDAPSPAFSVDAKDATEHTLDTGAAYVLDHANRKVYIKVTEPDGEKLRATGGDFDQFLKSLSPEDQAAIAKRGSKPAASVPSASTK